MDLFFSVILWMKQNQNRYFPDQQWEKLQMLYLCRSYQKYEQAFLSADDMEDRVPSNAILLFRFPVSASFSAE